MSENKSHNLCECSIASQFVRSSSPEQRDHHESSLPEHVCRHVQGTTAPPFFGLRSVCQSVTLVHPCGQTMVALDMDGKVHKPQFELDSEQVRYKHRFAPFNSVVTPPPVHYIQFKVGAFVLWTFRASFLRI